MCTYWRESEKIGRVYEMELIPDPNALVVRVYESALNVDHQKGSLICIKVFLLHRIKRLGRVYDIKHIADSERLGHVFECVLIAENQKGLVVFMMVNVLQTQKGLFVCIKV